MAVTSWRARMQRKYASTVALWLVTIGYFEHELAPVVQDMSNGFVCSGQNAHGWNMKWESMRPVLKQELAKP